MFFIIDTEKVSGTNKVVLFWQVVITKCYHLFCNPCLQRIIETRHRKCPICAASFGANDIKPIYI
ncbi:hypothetical protein ABFX02_11G091700 [Erythranthe guttata]